MPDKGFKLKNVHNISNIQVIPWEIHKPNEIEIHVWVSVDIDLDIQIAWDQHELEWDPIYGKELHLVQPMYCLRYILFQ